MGMRASDVSFLRREILPILERAAAISPEAGKAAEHLTARLEQLPTENPEGFALVEWSTQPLRLHVDGHQVPFLEASRLEDDRISVTLDHRFGIITTEEELARWAWFLSRGMGVAAERTAHGDRPFLLYTTNPESPAST